MSFPTAQRRQDEKTITVPDEANGAIIGAHRTSATELKYPLWLIHDDDSPQKSLQSMIFSLHPTTRESATVSNIASVPRGPHVILLADLDMTSMDGQTLKDLQFVFQRASCIIWTTCSNGPSDVHNAWDDESSRNRISEPLCLLRRPLGFSKRRASSSKSDLPDLRASKQRCSHRRKAYRRQRWESHTPANMY